MIFTIYVSDCNYSVEYLCRLDTEELFKFQLTGDLTHDFRKFKLMKRTILSKSDEDKVGIIIMISQYSSCRVLFTCPTSCHLHI